jgi:protein-S-isoprenylcysteine O-methyltransferase Ste14
MLPSFRPENRRLSARTYNRPLFFVRLASVYLLVALILVLSRPTPLLVTIGFAVTAIGEAIRFWAAGHLLKTEELVTSGPYRFTRNPLYLGRLLIFIGLCIMARLRYGANWLVLVLGCAVFFGYYLRRKERVEPERLRVKHGEAFERYYRAVPALFPTMHPYPEGASAGWSSDRMLRNREHWMVIVVVAISLLMLWRAYSLEGDALGGEASARPAEPPAVPSQAR